MATSFETDVTTDVVERRGAVPHDFRERLVNQVVTVGMLTPHGCSFPFASATC